MSTFVRRRTPFPLDHLANITMFGVTVVVDIAALLMGAPFEIFSLMVGIAQPVLISIWCVLGRPSAVFRWSFGLGLLLLLCVVKATIFATDLFSSGILALYYLHHFTIFPLAVLLGRPQGAVDQQNENPLPPPVQAGSSWRFGLKESFAFITLAAILSAVARGSLLHGPPSFRTSPADDWLYLVALAMYLVVLYAVTLPAVWTVWGIDAYFFPRQDFLTETSLLVYPLVALVTLCAIPFIIPSAFELLVLLPALFAARYDAQAQQIPERA